MTTITPVTSALSAAFGRFDQASSDILRATGTSPKDLAGPIADQVLAKAAIGASIVALKIKDESTKALLDIVV